ncbi:MAG: OPT/YSL family transporter [Firmicutes bacterium]|nr:OPT/YSL family transporter [Bacillota bacterium]
MNEKQLTIRGLLIGSIGSIILTMSSMFIALKSSSLPWPIMFVVLVSMVSLKVLGNTNLQEINVTQTAMSAGAMVAGGLAFTIPGIWMLKPDTELSVPVLLVIALGGTILGLIFTALFRKYFIETKELPYAMGQAAAATLEVGDKDMKKSVLLFVSMGAAGIFTWLRDWSMKLPATLLSNKMMSYGSMAGIWLSPMLISIGYIIGPVVIGVWFLGALIGDFGILFGGVEMGLWDSVTAANIKSSLGIGMMVGTGVGILVKGIIPKAKDIFGSMFIKDRLGDNFINMRWAPFVLVIVAAAFTFITDMGIVASVITILGAWLATSMSAQCVGQSGINPMEIFGIIILLGAKAVSSIGETEAFYVAAVVAIACGLVGDVMNDFKAGHILNTDPKAQWLAEVVGGLIGAVVSVIILAVILMAYGSEAFGGEMFPAAQASAVAAMVGGISHVPSFIIGLVIAVILYFVNFPVITLGLGVYLPFYLSATAFIGGVIRLAVDKVCPQFEEDGKGTIIASGLLGGESIVGVIIAIVMAIQILNA